MDVHAPNGPVDLRSLPTCPVHPGSTVRRFRTHGPHGPGVYPQCVPAGREPAHLLSWSPLRARVEAHATPDLTPSELAVLYDAAEGMTSSECASKRHKSTETVKSQRKAILMKLGARNMAQAVAVGVRESLIELDRAS